MKSKAFSAILAAACALCAAACAAFAGCSLLHDHSDPKSVKIDGKTYVTGFYENLWTDGIPYLREEPADYESKTHQWWKLRDTPFDMYCAEHKEALIWQPAVYCLEGQYDKAKAYYKDPQNYDYYIGIYLDDDNHVKADGDRRLLEEVVSAAMQFEQTALRGGVFDPYRDKKVTYGVAWLEWQRPTVYRVSRDGLFTTIHLELAIYDGKLLIPHTGGESESAFYDLFPEEAGSYVIELFYKYGII